MAKNEVELTFKLVNSAFNAGVKEINNNVTTLNKTFKAQAEEMKLTSSESEKLQAKLNNLNDQYEMSQQKTRLVESGLQNVKELFGENSKEAQTWSNKLADAKKNQAYLANAITTTTAKLKEAKTAEAANTAEAQKAAEASKQRQAALKSLASEQEHLKSSSEQIQAQYKLEVAELGNNAKATDKAKLSKKYYADQEKATAAQVKNLDAQLEIARNEYGQNSAEVDKLEKQLIETKTAHQNFANSLANSNNTLKNLGSSATKLGGQLTSAGSTLTKGLTLPIVAGVAASVKAAADFDSSFAGVKKTVDEVKDSNGKTVISYSDLEKQVRSLAKSIPASTDEINNVAAAAGQLGIKTQNVMGFTKTMIAMGVATNLTSEEAATSLAQLANITQMPQKNFDRLGASIVNLGNNMATTEADIVAMSLRLAGTGHQVGMTEAQITGMAAAMSSLGINAEAGGSAMSRVMQQMNTAVLGGGKNLNKFAQISGMSSSQFQKAWKDDASQAIVAFVKGLGKVKDSGGDVTGTLSQMGITSVQMVDTLSRLAGGGDILSKGLKVSAEGWKENKALTDEANKRYETFQSKLTIVKNKVKDLAIEFGGPLMDALSDVLDTLEPVFKVIGNLAKSFSSASSGTKKFVLIMIALLAAIGPVLSIVGTLVTVFGAIATAAGAPAAAITAMVVAIVAIVTVLVIWIITHWDEIKKKTVEVFSSIGQFFSDLWQSISDTAVAVWTSLTDWLSQTWQSIVTNVTNFFQPVADFFSGLWQGIQDLAITFWQGIIIIVFGLWQMLVAGVSAIFSPVIDFFSSLWTSVSTTTSNAWTALTTWLSGIWQNIVNTAIGILTPVINFIANIWRSISTTTSNVWSGIVNFLSGIWQRITSFVSNGVNSVRTTVSNIWNGLVGIVQGIWNRIVEGISTPLNRAKDFVRNAIEAIKGFFSFQIHWPHIPMPHFSISGSLNPLDWLKDGVPKIGVKFYAKGGIMTQPTIMGGGSGLNIGGEAGPEGVIPLNRNVLGQIGAGVVNSTKEIMQAVTNSTRNQSAVINITASVRDDADIKKIAAQVKQVFTDETDTKNGAWGGA